MPTATLTTKGQITVPKAIRDRLGVDSGDRLAFRVREDGAVVLEPETVDLLSLRGMVKPEVRGVSIEDMKETIRRAGGRK